MTTPDTKMLSAERLAEITRKIGQWDHAIADQIAAHTDALTARVAELERECATLAAGQCIVKNGLIGDEWGNQYCKPDTELAAARAPVEESEIAASAESLRLRLSSRARARVEEYAEACEAMKDTRALASDLRTLLILESRLAPAADLIARLARERGEARDKALEEASNIVAGASVAVNYLPDLKTPNDLAAYLTRRDLKLAEEIRALKSVKGE